jgi:hypothetical protein
MNSLAGGVVVTVACITQFPLESCVTVVLAPVISPAGA